MTEEVARVATFATQSAGQEVAGGLAGRPLLLFHAYREELLPAQSIEMVRMAAGHGEVVVARRAGVTSAGFSPAIIVERLDHWLLSVWGSGRHPDEGLPLLIAGEFDDQIVDRRDETFQQFGELLALGVVEGLEQPLHAQRAASERPG